jgi:DNA helicase-2/ATP-dependent DNA helicase PcrA
MVGPAEYLAYAQSLSGIEAPKQIALAHLYAAYQATMAQSGLFDFDDTIFEVVRALETDSTLLAAYRARYTHIMADEYQDSNYSQMRLLELMAPPPHGNVMVVADDDQAIYRFRGASLASLRRFAHVYSQHRTVKLEQNYRSSHNVVAAAQNLIRANLQERFPKPNAARYDGPPVSLLVCDNRHQEIAQIIAEMTRLHASGLSYGEMAVLARTNALLRPFLLALQVKQIPYQIFGGRGFLDQGEIRDLIGFLRAVLNPGDSLALARVFSMYGFGISPTTQARLCASAAKAGLSLEDITDALLLQSREQPDSLPPFLVAPLASIHLALEIVRDVREFASRRRADEVVYQILNATGFVDLLRYDSEPVRTQIGANLNKFVSLAENFAANHPDNSLAAFIDYLQQVEAAGAEQSLAVIDSQSDAVQLMTIHQAKGLEFRAVFLPSWVEGRFPMNRQSEPFALPLALIQEDLVTSNDHSSEERRLAYVATTRAKDHLYISYAKKYEGNKNWKPSRFLLEMGMVTKQGQPSERAHLLLPTAAPIVIPKVAGLVSPEAFRADPALPLVLGYSALETYDDCPQRYQYAYIYRLPVPERVEGQIGTIVHRALQLIVGHNSVRVMPLDEALAILEAEFARVRFVDPVNLNPHLERAKNMIRNLYTAGRLRGAKLLEQPFRLRVAGLTSRGEIDFILNGVIDRIDQDGTLIDYKTGRLPDNLNTMPQLGAYALAATQALSLAVAKLEIIDIDGLAHPVIKSPTQLEADTKMMLEAAAGIAAADFTPKPSAWKCAICPFRLLCPSAE